MNDNSLYDSTYRRFPDYFGSKPDNLLIEHHHLLDRGEILRLFESYQAVYHREGLGEEHCHGDGPPERHASIRAVFRKM